MKRILSIFLLTVATCLSIYSHPGRTDSDGGHNDNSAGEYHYHHGYPAHQHKNGVCPYDYDDKTNHSSSSSGSGTAKITKEKPTPTPNIDTSSRTDKEDSTKDSLLKMAEVLILVIMASYIFAFFCCHKHKK